MSVDPMCRDWKAEFVLAASDMIESVGVLERAGWNRMSVQRWVIDRNVDGKEGGDLRVVLFCLGRTGKSGLKG